MTTTLVRLRPPDYGKQSRRYCDVDAAHRWGLPGLKGCPGCGATWAMTGVAYPTIDLGKMPNVDRYRNVWPVPISELNELRLPICDLMWPGAFLPPGTAFGPLEGTVTGACDLIEWLNPWTLLAQGIVVD